MYTLVDHEVTPFSDHEYIREWLDRLRALRAADPDDEGIASALRGVESIAREVGILTDMVDP